MTLVWVAIGFVGLLAIKAIGDVIGGLIGDEVRGWIGRVPYALLWIACRRVPTSHRFELHADWTADIEAKLADKTDRPMTRLFVGIRFAASLIRGARRVAVELGPVRSSERTGETGVPVGVAALPIRTYARITLPYSYRELERQFVSMIESRFQTELEERTDYAGGGVRFRDRRGEFYYFHAGRLGFAWSGPMNRSPEYVWYHRWYARSNESGVGQVWDT